MPDQQINWQLVIQGLKEATADVDTLKQKLKEVQDLKDKAYQIGNTNAYQQLSKLEEDLYRQRSKIEADFTKQKDAAYQKYLQQEQKIQQQISETERLRERAQTKAYDAHMSQKKKSEDYWLNAQLNHMQNIEKLSEKQRISEDKIFSQYQANYQKRLAQEKALIDQKVNAEITALEKEKQRQQTGNPALERQQLARADSLNRNYRQSDLDAVFGYTRYQQQLRQLNNEAQQLFQTARMSNKPEDWQAFAKVKNDFNEVNKGLLEYNKQMGFAGEKTSYLGSLGQKLRSHFNWIVAGTMIGATAGGVYSFFESMSTIEKQMAGFEQVMATPEKTIKNLKDSLGTLKDSVDGIDLSKLGDIPPDAISKVNELKKATQGFFDIASKYGETFQDVTEAGKLFGRAYKDNAIVMTLVEAASKIAVADSFEMKEAYKALDSTILQWGFDIKNSNDALTVSNHIIDSWTNIAHNAAVSAQTMAAANERAASTAKMLGLNFDFTQAIIATMASKTQAAGGEIGNAVKSILTSIHSSKAITELENFGISVYKIGQDGKKEFKDMSDLLVEIMIKAQGTTQNVENLYRTLAGGERKLAA